MLTLKSWLSDGFVSLQLTSIMNYCLYTILVLLFSGFTATSQWTTHRVGTQASLTQALAIGNGTLILSDSLQAWLSLNSSLNWNSYANALSKTTVLVKGNGSIIWAGNRTGPVYWNYSNDSGRTWINAVGGPGSPGVLDVSSISGTPYRFACGSGIAVNQLLMSRDGGQTFTTLNIPVWQGMARRTSFLDTLTGFLGDHDGALFKTTNQGQSWQMVNMLATGMIQETTAIKFFTDSAGVLVYRSGVNFYTTDRGNTWTMGNSHLYYPVDDVLLMGDSIVLALTRQNQFPLSISYDRGQTFVADSTFSPTLACNRLHRLQDGRVMILGDSGTYWLNAGIVASSPVLSQINLKIFPNPGTNYFQISGLPEDDSIGMEIFNLNGQLVKSFPPQSTRTWSVTDLPQGQYLLRLFGKKFQTQSIWVKQ